MTPEELRNAAAVMLAAAEGKPIEHKSPHSDEWYPIAEPNWYWFDFEYRVAVTKPSINWNHVHPDYVAMATDKNGTSWLYEKTPILTQLAWQCAGGDMATATAFTSFTNGTCDWKESLVLRPVKGV